MPVKGLALDISYLKSAVPIFDAFLKGPLKRTKGHCLRHSNVLIKKGHIVVDAFENTRSCRIERVARYILWCVHPEIMGNVKVMNF